MIWVWVGVFGWEVGCYEEGVREVWGRVEVDGRMDVWWRGMVERN